MRKVFYFILIVTMLFSFTACSKNQGEGENKKVSISGSVSEVSDIEGLKLLCDDESSFNNHFTTDSGFYYFTQTQKISDNLYGFYLMYVDYATKKEVYLCTDSGCRHNNQNCSSVFSSGEFGLDCLLFVHNGYLYVLNRDFDQDGSTSISTNFSYDGNNIEPENRVVELYRLELDGSSREKIFTFPVNTTVEKMIFSNGENLCFITKELVFSKEEGATYASSANRNFVNFNLANNKIEDTISLELSTDKQYQVVGGSGTKLVLSTMEYPNGMTENEIRKLNDSDWINIFSKCFTVLVTFDIESKETKEIFRASHNKGYTLTHVVQDGYLYVSDYDENVIEKVDISTGKKKTLSDEAYYINNIFDESLCCFDNTEKLSLCFIDKESGVLSHCTLTNKSIGKALDILSEANDKVLVIYDYDIISNDGESYEIKQNKFALILKSDLYESRGNFEPIDMIGSGK